MKRAHYNISTGQIVGFFDPSLHQVIPEPTVEIPDEIWAGHVDGSSPKAVDLASGEFVDFVPEPVPVAETVAFREAQAREECRRRIYAQADREAQMNMATAAAVAAATPAEPAAASMLATVGAALGWVTAMRETWPILAADLDADIFDDASWPDCPADVVALAASM